MDFGSTATSSNVSINDAGSYTCTATNVGGPSISNTVIPQEIRDCKRVAIATIDFGTTFCSLVQPAQYEDLIMIRHSFIQSTQLQAFWSRLTLLGLNFHEMPSLTKKFLE